MTTQQGNYRKEKRVGFGFFFRSIYHAVQGAGVWHVASISVEPHQFPHFSVNTENISLFQLKQSFSQKELKTNKIINSF